MKLLDSKQISNITIAICEVQFLEKNIEDISFKDKMTQLVWTGIKHAIDASVKGYVNKKGGIDIPLARGAENVTTPLEQGEEEEEEKEKEEYPDLNKEAFNMWCEYKGASYSAKGKALSRNKLLKHDKQTQIDMVENSILNNYKGLFEVNSQQVNKTSNLDIKDKDYGNGGSF